MTNPDELAPPSADELAPTYIDRPRADSQQPTLQEQLPPGTPLPAMPTLNTRRDHHLELAQVIGRGGMGEVVLARDRDLGREVVVKQMLPGMQANPGATRRFLEEARVTGLLDHPNVVPVHEFGLSERGQLFFSMKRVVGQDLDELVKRLARGGRREMRRWGTSARLRMFLKVCDAIAYSHSKAVIHRDLKPANIMIGAFGEVLVMDWGLAKVIDEDRSAAPNVELAEMAVTAKGQLVGTPAYMSPEQARGEQSALDARSDQYALGAILLELLTLRRPVHAKSVILVVERVARGDYDRIGDLEGDPPVPRELVAVVERAMAADPRDRYPSVQALATDIEAYLEGGALEAAEYTTWQLAVKWTRRNPTLAAVGAVLLLGALTVGPIFGLQQQRAARLERDRARKAEQLGQLASARADEAAQREEAARKRRAAVEPYAIAQGLLRYGPSRQTIEQQVIPKLRQAWLADPSFDDAPRALAELYLTLGQSQRAEEQLGKLLERDLPAAHDLRLQRVRALVELGALTHARQQLEQLPPASAQHAAAAGWIALAAGRRADARKLSGELIARGGREREGAWRRLRWTGYWVAARLAYDPDEDAGGGIAALPLLDRVVDLAPGFPRARVTRARLRLELRDVGGARADLEAARRLLPDSPEVILLAARFAGDYENQNAIAVYERLLRRPECREDARLLQLKARAHRINKQPQLEQATLELLFALHRKRKDVASGRAIVRHFEYCGRQAESLPILAALLESADPQQRAPLLADQGRAQFRVNKMEEAERSLRAALELEPTHSDALVVLARVLSETARLPESVALLEAAIKRTPHDFFVLSRLAQNAGRLAHIDRAWTDKAAAYFDRCAELAPDLAIVPITRARFQRRVERWPGLERSYMLARALAERQGDLTRTSMAIGELARHYESRAQFDQAIAQQKELIPFGEERARQAIQRLTLFKQLMARPPRDGFEAGVKARFLRARGELAAAAPLYASAVQAYEQAIQSQRSFSAFMGLVQTRRAYAETLLELERAPAALEQARRAANVAQGVVNGSRLSRSAKRGLLEEGAKALALAVRAHAANPTPASAPEVFAFIARLRQISPGHIPPLQRHPGVSGAGWPRDPRWSGGGR